MRRWIFILDMTLNGFQINVLYFRMQPAVKVSLFYDNYWITWALLYSHDLEGVRIV